MEIFQRIPQARHPHRELLCGGRIGRRILAFRAHQIIQQGRRLFRVGGIGVGHRIGADLRRDAPCLIGNSLDESLRPLCGKRPQDAQRAVRHFNSTQRGPGRHRLDLRRVITVEKVELARGKGLFRFQRLADRLGIQVYLPRCIVDQRLLQKIGQAQRIQDLRPAFVQGAG